MSRVTYDAGNLTIEVDGLDTVAAALLSPPTVRGALALVSVDSALAQAPLR